MATGTESTLSIYFETFHFFTFLRANIIIDGITRSCSYCEESLYIFVRLNDLAKPLFFKIIIKHEPVKWVQCKIIVQCPLNGQHHKRVSGAIGGLIGGLI